MKPAPFEYFAPNSLEDALQLLNQHGYDAKVLAGGQSLIPTMNFRLAQPTVLVDLNNIRELCYIKLGKSDATNIGAMTRQRQVENHELIKSNAPLIYEAMPFIAHPQIRNRGTIGGSIAHADPASELPAIALVLQAKLKLVGLSGERWLDANDFFTGLFSTALQPEEILTEISIPAIPENTGYAFQEISRRHGDYAMVGIAASITLDKQQKCKDAQIALFSVGDAPIKANQAEQLLVGESVSEKLLEEAADVISSSDIDPPSDIHASAKYRRHLAKVLSKRVLESAFRRANSS